MVGSHGNEPRFLFLFMSILPLRFMVVLSTRDRDKSGSTSVDTVVASSSSEFMIGVEAKSDSLNVLAGKQLQETYDGVSCYLVCYW